MSQPSEPTGFLESEDGASLPEYALLLGLVAIVCVAAMAVLGSSISNVFSSASTSI